MSTGSTANPALFGWVPPQDRTAEMQKIVEKFFASLQTVFFSQSAFGLAESGKGKVVLLHKYITDLLGYFPIHKQTIGDCTSHGWGGAIDVLKAVEIVLNKENESFTAETCTEALYADSRVRVGQGKLGNSDGSVGAWLAKTVIEGVLLRKEYGKYDLRKYNGQLAKNWGFSGLPKELYTPMKENPVQTVSLVTTYEAARDAIANGYPVPVCSGQGFTTTRDKDGFAKASGTWWHCMYFLACDDASKRPGLLCMNSWGPDWINGPKRHEQPDGSFWVDADVVNKMLRGEDSFAISNFKGYPGRKVDHSLI